MSTVSEMICETLQEYTGGLRTEVQHLQTGTISTNNRRIDKANVVMNDVQQRMLGTQEGCRTLLATFAG